MGACYSRKAGGGKHTYSTVQMASTKLEEPSRLSRPTPYSRNAVAASPSFTSRKGIPLPSNRCRVGNSNETIDTKNSKVQSSIPRLNSPISNAKIELNDNVVISTSDKNENSELHIVNNNSVQRSQSNSSIHSSGHQSSPITTNKQGASRILQFGKSDKKTRLSPRIEEKSFAPRIPVKSSPHITTTTQRSFLPQSVPFSKPINVISPVNESKQITSHIRQNSTEKLSYEVSLTSPSSNGSQESDCKKSFVTSTSHDSISDFDSGLGNSLVEQSKQEDADTLQGIERLENLDESAKVSQVKSPSCSKNTFLDNTVKCPMYKRNLNGKWTIDSENQSQLSNKTMQNNSHDSANKNSKITFSPVNTFPTYASYKGHMSYKKNIVKPNLPSVPSDVSKQESIKHSIKDDKTGIHSISSQQNVQCPSKILNSPPSPEHRVKSSSESDDKSSEGLGSESKSPPSEIENREFLIDDEIYDQPDLVSVENGKLTESPLPSLQQSVTELHSLQMSSSVKKRGSTVSMKHLRERLGSDHRDSLLICSELGSSCSSIASDDLMLDYEKKNDFPDGTVNEGLASPERKVSDLRSIDEQLSALGLEKVQNIEFEDRARKRLFRRSSGSVLGNSHSKEDWRLRSVSLPLRPPRPISVSEADDGSLILDPSSYRLFSLDLNGIKTSLFRLKTVLQEAEIINPFDQANTKNIFYQSLVQNDFPVGSMFSHGKHDEDDTSNPAKLSIENADLRRQVVLLQQQLEDKDRTVRLLQQQMTKYTNSCAINQGVGDVNNAATQTDRMRSLTNSLSPSIENSCETLVSVQDAFEKHVSECIKEQTSFKSQMEKVSCSLSNLTENLHVAANKYSYFQNRSVSATDLSADQS